MVDSAQNRLNLRTVERLVATEMGLEWPNNDTLSRDVRIDFNRKLAARILTYPERFTEQTLGTARRVVGKVYEPLDDPAFSPSDFIGFVGENATGLLADVAEVGTGVRRTFALAGWVIPAAALAVVGVMLWRFAKKTT